MHQKWVSTSIFNVECACYQIFARIHGMFLHNCFFLPDDANESMKDTVEKLLRIFDQLPFTGNCSVKVDSQHPKSPPGFGNTDSCNEVFPNLFISEGYVLFPYMLMRYHY